MLKFLALKLLGVARQYWLLLTIVAGIGAFYLYAFQSGVMAERAIWEAKAEEARKAQEKADLKARAAASISAEENAKNDRARDEELTRLEKELASVQSDRLRDCVADDDFLRLYEQAGTVD